MCKLRFQGFRIKIIKFYLFQLIYFNSYSFQNRAGNRFLEKRGMVLVRNLNKC